MSAMKARAAAFRRRAILNRIHDALDAFYLLQKIDWEYDIRTTIDKILATALEEIEFGGGRQIERALLIIEGADVGTLEVKAGWKAEELDLGFSRTVVRQAMEEGAPILCENAKDDPRFLAAESLKALTTLSLICVPVTIGDRTVGALYIESHSASNIFNEEDLEFLQEFTRAIGPYLKMALVHQGHVQEIQKLRSEIDLRQGPDGIVGRSEAMRAVYDMVRLASQVDRTVLVTGESGCGKELVARSIHAQSPRRNRPLVVVDCSGLAEHLLESELFGHVRGAFTGASSDKRGAFEEADGGTIFLDEISDAPRSLQQKLRRVLQEGEIRRVGETRHHGVNVRVICATNRSLPDLVERGEFMRDLFFRINKLPIHVPPLRERREDIPLLVQHFVEHAARAGGAPPCGIAADAMELLARLPWQENNVRELRNAVELAIDLSGERDVDLETVERVLRVQRGERVTPRPLPKTEAAEPVAADDGVRASPGGGLVSIHRPAFQALLDESEQQINGGAAAGKDAKVDKRQTPFYRIQREVGARAIIEGLEATGWKLRPAARLLGISPMKLRGELRDFLEEVLDRHGGDLSATAAALHVPREVLEKKADDFGLEGVR